MNNHLRISLLTVCIAFSGCTYHGELRENFYNPPKESSRKIDGRITLSSKEDLMYDFKISTTLDTFKVDLKEQYLRAISEVLKKSFSSVSTSRNPEPDANFYAIPKITINTISYNKMAGDYTFELLAGLTIFDSRRGAKIKDYDSRKIINYSVPVSSNILAQITGLTAFITYPITQKASITIAGNHARDMFEDAISKALDEMLEDIVSDRGLYSESVLDVDANSGKKAENNKTTSNKSISDFLSATVVVSGRKGFGSGFFATKMALLLQINTSLNPKSKCL